MFSGSRVKIHHLINNMMEISLNDFYRMIQYHLAIKIHSAKVQTKILEFLNF